MAEDGSITLQAALKAQKALRTAAGLGDETFPVPAFVGMISDEIEQLRRSGRSDEDIALIIQQNSPIQITARDIAKHYAASDRRHPSK